MALREQSFCKITLFLIKDWDSFQMAMRGCLYSPRSYLPLPSADPEVAN
ncbi:MAG: hypothetical protein KQH63_00055 [Desulfobulbaceae bacterium]|nr:hypothetical protein [Desulfobulbaceae bacterium]